MSEHRRSSGVERPSQKHEAVPEKEQRVKVSRRSVDVPLTQNQVDWEEGRRRGQALE
jgi:hypothetical protein